MSSAWLATGMSAMPWRVLCLQEDLEGLLASTDDFVVVRPQHDGARAASVELVLLSASSDDEALLRLERVRRDVHPRWVIALTKSDVAPTLSVVRVVDLVLPPSGADSLPQRLRRVLSRPDHTADADTALQIWQAQKRESLGRMAGGIAHDFNNLLTALSAYAEVLRIRLAGLPEVEYVNQILAAAERAASLTRQMVAIAGRQVVAPGPVDLNARVTAMLMLLRGVLGGRISVRLDLATDAPFALVDQGQLDQVIMNLTLNARDAMADGGAVVLATERSRVAAPLAHAHGIVPPGEYAVLRIADEGEGMGPEVLARAFEPFFSTKPQGKGSGLGLATTLGIVTQARGHVTLESSLGAGTVATVYLPLVAMQPPAPAPVREDDAATTRRAVVLLAEDDDAVRELTGDILTSAGYAVRVAADGTAAMGFVEQGNEAIDLLLTDMVMPGTAVADIVRRFRSRYADAPIICMSGYPQSDLVQHGVLEQGVEFIAKPFSRAELLRRIDRALDVAREPGRAGRLPR